MIAPAIYAAAAARSAVRMAIRCREDARRRCCQFDRRIDRRVMRSFALEAIEHARASGFPLSTVWRPTAA